MTVMDDANKTGELKVEKVEDEDLNAIIGAPRRKERLVQLMREEVHFSDEAIARFAKTRLQIDGDY